MSLPKVYPKLCNIKHIHIHSNTLKPFNSQGTPGSGGIPQIWGNLKNQIWGNPPDMGKWENSKISFDFRIISRSGKIWAAKVKPRILTKIDQHFTE